MDIYDDVQEVPQNEPVQEDTKVDVKEEEPKEEEKKVNANEQEDIKITKEDALYLQRAREQEILNRTIEDIKLRHPKFDLGKVSDKLIELEEKEPGVGKTLCTPVGLENIWLNYFNNANSDNKMDNTRNHYEYDYDAVGKKIENGEASISEMKAFYTELGNIGTIKK